MKIGIRKVPTTAPSSPSKSDATQPPARAPYNPPNTPPITVQRMPRGSVLPPPSNNADCNGLPLIALKVDTMIENTIVSANWR